MNVIFIAVNPSTDNLSESLDYISALSYYLTSQTDSFMIRDRSMYSDIECADDLYRIFENGIIGYAFPDEIYRTDYMSFLAGKMSLDEFIDEADRKLSAYKGE